ncbi:MAG: sterol desaturase family protein [Ectothiorhodospiraceae bacterium]|nr:sterol desaturase family protein [Ectothiorhodospiraceae bacterium]MBN4053055.1 sterol desaturase family protein [Gammaproteobacteria bacterium AH-315-K14]
MEYILHNQTEIFSNLFYGTILGFLFLELLIPLREKAGSHAWKRWVNNIILGGFNIILVRLLLPVSTLGMSSFAGDQHLGIFNYFSLHFILEIVLTILLLDFIVYYYHKISHRYTYLWRLHLVHHTDTHVDITSSVRHHPIESLMAYSLIWVAILLFGISLVPVLLFELCNFSISVFSHANIKLPSKVDRYLRLIIVTPDFHRTHHSSDKVYTDSNYGTIFTWLDFLFSTQQNKHQSKQITMPLGLNYCRSDRDQIIDRLLLQPFRYTSFQKLRIKHRNSIKPIPDQQNIFKDIEN